MAESNPTQVILTDDGIKIIKAQNTADSAANGVTNLNDPNLMSVIEKQNNVVQFAGLTSQYSVLIQNAKDEGIDTTAVTTAYNNLNKFMADVLADPDHASDVDRATYKKYQDTYNEELANIQSALQNNTNNKFASAASATSQAASTANVAKSAADSAFSQAKTAIDNGNATSQAVTALKDGSTLTIAQLGSGLAEKVSNSEYASYKTQTANDINLRVATKDLIDQINLQAGNTLISSGGQLTLSGKNIYFDSTNPVIIPSANIDKLLVDKKLTAADISANTFTTNNETFTVDKNGLVTATSLVIRGTTNLVYNSALAGNNGSYIPGWNISNNGTCWSGNLHDGVPSIGFNASTGANAWANFAQTKLHPLNGATGHPFSASVWFKEYGSDTSLQWNLTLAFFDSNGNRINGDNASNWSGISSSQDWRYITINNAVAPSNAAYVGLQYWAYNGHGNAGFSSPMLTQTDQATGYQPDTGNVVSAGEIDGSVINGSTINGTTFNAGTQLNQYGNTSYPLTINQDGSVTSTSFGNIANEPAALRTVMKDGTVNTNFRGMNQLSTGVYPAADISMGAGQLVLLEGYSTSQDPNFTATNLTKTGYAILDASTGLSLHGVTQAINFSGTDQDQTTGIKMNSYGNILGYQNSTWWRIVDFSGNQLANFGIDRGGSNPIQFNRELDIGNIGINTAHSIISKDGNGLYINSGRGGRADLNVASLNYTGSVSKSLLSEKKDVKKVDTAYWAQLVNSIDLATYQYKDDDNTSNLRLSGIVDDVNDTKQWQLPDVFVARDEDGKLAGIENTVLQNAMLATIQEQQKEIDKLNGHLLELEAKLNG